MGAASQFPWVSGGVLYTLLIMQINVLHSKVRLRHHSGTEAQCINNGSAMPSFDHPGCPISDGGHYRPGTGSSAAISELNHGPISI